MSLKELIEMADEILPDEEESISEIPKISEKISILTKVLRTHHIILELMNEGLDVKQLESDEKPERVLEKFEDITRKVRDKLHLSAKILNSLD